MIFNEKIYNIENNQMYYRLKWSGRNNADIGAHTLDVTCRVRCFNFFQ